MSGFGRKGLGQEPPRAQAQPQSHPASNGLEGLRNSARSAPRPPSDAMARRVDAFAAAERAQRNRGGISDLAAGFQGNARPTRSLFMAYVLWFILGQVSAHRFYLGAYHSAFAQVGLFALWVVLAITRINALGPVVAIGLIGWALWVLGDVFFIHRIHRKYCRNPGESAAAFA